MGGHPLAGRTTARTVVPFWPAPLGDEDVLAAHRRADSPRRTLVLPDEHGQRETGGAEKPLPPGPVVVPVDMRMPGRVPRVRGQAQRPGTVEEQPVQQAGGPVHIPGTEDLTQEERRLAHPVDVMGGEVEQARLAVFPEYGDDRARGRGTTAGQSVHQGGGTAGVGEYGVPGGPGTGGTGRTGRTGRTEGMRGTGGIGRRWGGSGHAENVTHIAEF